MWPGVSHPQKTSDLKWVYGPISRKEWRWWVGRCELASEALHVPVVRCRDLTDERSVVLA